MQRIASVMRAAALAFLAMLATGAAEARTHAYSTHGTTQSGDTASRGCLIPAARALMARIEAQFGPMQVISTCRPGAVVAGTGHPSRHRYGAAVDFVAGDRKAAVVAWLVQNHMSGGTMTYSSSPHIHVDIGPHWVSLAGSRAFRHTHTHPVS